MAELVSKEILTCILLSYSLSFCFTRHDDSAFDISQFLIGLLGDMSHMFTIHLVKLLSEFNTILEC